MNAAVEGWTPYQMAHVVDVNDAQMLVRTYIEQTDLRRYVSLVSQRKQIGEAIEFGCGFGRMTQVLTEFATHVVGIEREPSLVAEAARLSPEATFYQANDLSNVPLRDEEADLIITFTFLQHLRDSEARKVTTEMMRCLRRDGCILICEETDEEHLVGDVNSPLGRCTIGRSVERYREYFSPLALELTAPRRVEPGYPRANTGTYMLFHKDP